MATKRVIKKTAKKSSANRKSRKMTVAAASGSKPEMHKSRLVDKNRIVKVFMDMITMIKIYHWNTRSYAQHKATDELHERLSANVDKFIETLLGKKEDRFSHLSTTIPLATTAPRKFKARLYWFRDYLVSLNSVFDDNGSGAHSDLLNIRDEILGDLNQFLYLMTLDK